MPVHWVSTANTQPAVDLGGDLDTVNDICKLSMVWLGAEPTSITNVETITSTSTKEEVLCNSIYNSARKAVLEDYNWQFAKRHFMLNPADGYWESPAGNANNAYVPITGISKADPAVISTNNNHGFSDGWLVKINNVVGMTQINNRVVRVGNNNGNTFEAYGLNSTNFNNYTSGGNAIRFEAYQDYQSGYVFDVPADYLKAVHVEGRPQYELIGSGNSQRILCTEQYPIIEYIADVSTVTEMTEGFKRAWAGRIAAELANPLQKENASMKDMWAWYQQILERESKPSDSTSVDPKHMIRETSQVLKDGGWQ